MKQEIFNTSVIATTNSQMVEIPAGTIELREDRIKHKWTVDIHPFLLAKYPITQDLYFQITNESPGTFKGDKKPVETVYGSYRILRGGGWYDEESSCMATVRRRSHPTKFKVDDLGFRLARNV